MFGWLKRKQLEEQLKLLFQNGIAAYSLQGPFMIKGDYGLVEELKDIETKTRHIAQCYNKTDYMTKDDLQNLIDMNKKLREIFASSPTSALESFDTSYSPPSGWKHYFNEEFYER